MSAKKENITVLISDILIHHELVTPQNEGLSQRNSEMIMLLNEKHGGTEVFIYKESIIAFFERLPDALNSARESKKIVSAQHVFDVNYRVFPCLDIEKIKSNPESLLPTISHYEQHRNQIFVDAQLIVNLNGSDKSDLIPIASSKTPVVSEPIEKSMDEQLLDQLTRVVEENLTNEQFSVEDLAGALAISRSNLHRKLTKLKKQSISQFIRSIRLEKSMDLLEREVATVSEIAYRVGFGSPAYFIKCFHEQYGYPPGEVKKQNASSVSSNPKRTVKTGQTHISKFEAINPNASQAIIEEVFEEMVKNKPTLEKFLVVDEDIDLGVDIRLLAYQIIKNYPWPVGIEIRRLFSASLHEMNKKRLDQLCRLIDRVVQFISFLTLAELDRMAFQVNTEKKDMMHVDISRYLEGVSYHTSYDLMQKIKTLDLDADWKTNAFIKELPELLDSSFFREFSDWVDTRADFDKNKDVLSQDAIEEYGMELEQTLIFFLKKISFLINYRLVNVGDILVEKPKFKSVSFKHRFNLLNSTDSEFKEYHEDTLHYSDSKSILLMRDIRDTTQFLNLSPFMIDTHDYDIESQQLIQDIYLFQSLKGEQLIYKGTESQQEGHFESIENFDFLKKEWIELNARIGGKL